MSGGEPVIDIRGEPCGMPVLRVERFMDGESSGRPFIVIGDHEQTLDQLRLLAVRRGWTCEAAMESRHEWRARFVPAAFVDP